MRLVLAAQRAALEPARLALLEFLQAADPTPALVFQAELVVEEVLMNIVWHAYPEGGTREMRLEAEWLPQELVLTFEDDGVPFDPTQARPARPAATLAEAVPGGLGVGLVRRYAKAMAYCRVDARNRLAVTLSRG
ncbi:hypothetical protein UC35_15195 [Ramlibacter tataouinensis]|uniref:Histidine kinase/HSP90-like ATPase domain-containing protein n=1 Tax=Ramlibacter tataouinensis TaxID=94132 RepID=A0A127JZU1_9BURK|nr:hypothetical protein UC35_15195 [Ramlibacter tataouinensis]